MFISSFVNFFIGASFVLISMIKDINRNLHSLQIERVEGEVDESKRILFEFMDFYPKARELS